MEVSRPGSPVTDAGVRLFLRRVVALAHALSRVLVRRKSDVVPAPGPACRALTLAAMALPGIAAAADEEDARIQYSRFEEGGRSEWSGAGSALRKFAPLRVESVHAGTGLRLSDRLKLAFDFLQDTWSGATPILSAPEGFMTVTGASAYPLTDARVRRSLVPGAPGLIHMMTAASAETRRQADLAFTYEGRAATIDVGVGVSDEPDYRSRFGRVDVSHDFDNRLTTLSGGLGYTSSAIDANLGPSTDWMDYGRYRNAASGPSVTSIGQGGLTVQRFRGDRQAWSARVGLKHVITRRSSVSASLAYDHDSGFLENPYKLVMIAFADPATPPLLFGGQWLTRIFNVAESRPETRAQWTAGLRYSHYFDAPDAALHVDYRFGADDWGVQSHTAEAFWSQAAGDDWLVTPRVRYYTQSAADFYQPWFILARRAPTRPDGTLDFSGVPLQHYASDHRLSAYGAVSAGVAASRDLQRGLRLEAGFEYYRHAGGLRPGGEDAFADFHYWLFNVGLRLDLRPGASARSVEVMRAAVAGDTTEHEGHQGHDGHEMSDAQHAHHGDDGGHGDHRAHPGALAPVGVMSAHMVAPGDGVMLAYRFMATRQGGQMRTGTSAAPDSAILSGGCGAVDCTFVPTRMVMHMHMLDVMAAPTEGVNLMAMVQAMDMDMGMRPLEGTIVSSGGVHSHGGHDRHGSGGLGDTTLSALVRVLAVPGHAMHAGIGVSVPTGAIDQTMSTGDLLDYGMQRGSGTWDLLPSLTYNGTAGRWFWGAQASVVRRPHRANDLGYTLGDSRQATAWLGASMGDSMSFTVRGVQTTQDGIRGRFNRPAMLMSPTDVPANYGGRYTDIGLGFNVVLREAHGRTDRFGVEWLEPVRDRVDGFQLPRQGTLWLSASTVF